jgi:hypothetical protein
MPRRNENATKGGNFHPRGAGSGWMHKGGRRKPNREDRAPLTPGSMHSKTRLR